MSGEEDVVMCEGRLTSEGRSEGGVLVSEREKKRLYTPKNNQTTSSSLLLLLLLLSYVVFYVDVYEGWP